MDGGSVILSDDNPISGRKHKSERSKKAGKGKKKHPVQVEANLNSISHEDSFSAVCCFSAYSGR
jgi:hypothetical protein